ncbi:MAG: bifunctional methionine sulfoxide reductase B/A protein [Planctomycetaceae bacterium]|jgi:peptide methionine sulfoxide reductase msrA/msrB
MPLLSVFNREGKLLPPREIPPLVLSDSEWRKRLPPERYRILRAQGTERAFCGTLLDNKQSGVYTCGGCGLPLFSSQTKFHSGTGWPSFFQSIAPGNVEERTDRSHGMVRVEILCGRCGGHLGHVFNDGPPPTGLRYCLNSESLDFTPEDRLGELADPAAEAPPPASPAGTQQLVLAGGCFWCTELAFEQLAGVLDVESGYCGGDPQRANYREVCEGNTGHAEAIRITYDPARISLDQLLDVFFEAHDPTQKNRQGNDVGTQYRSAIFHADEAQRSAAKQKIEVLEAARRFPRPIVTTLEPLGVFHAAEAYHQDYARQNPSQPYIQHHAVPRACQIREKYPQLLAR